MGNAPTSLCSTSTFLEFGLIVVAQACAGQSTLQRQIWNILIFQTQACFFNSDRDFNFICSIACLEQRHLLQKLLKQGPCRCPPQGKAHAQLCAKGCFSCLRPMDTTYARLHKTNTTPWENMRRLFVKYLCVHLSCVTGPPLYCKKQPQYVHTNIFHKWFCLKTGLYPGTKCCSSMNCR